MISLLGNTILLFSIFTSILACISINKHYSKYLIYSSCISIIITFLLLIFAFIISDFSLHTVFLNSSTIKPLIFKIGASWASHEGSMLLFFTLLSITILIYLLCIQKIYISYNNFKYDIIISAIIIVCFASYIYLTSNPFDKISFKPYEGLGLNPLLQDIGLIIHPPILYLGYVFYITSLIRTLVILLDDKNHYVLLTLKLTQIFINLGVIFITLGITLGSWWAYRELGWGGYWFFDPVENISLLPWLSAIALYHSISVTIKYGKLINWTMILSILTFLISVFGTLLVRSGIIVSVHSFASSKKRGIYMMIVFLILSIPSIFIYFIKLYKGKIKLIYTIINKETIDIKNTKNTISCNIGLSNILFMITIVVLLFSILYPVVILIYQKKTISINDSYFINIFLPICLAIIILCQIFSNNINSYSKILVIYFISLIITFIIYIISNCTIISVLAIFISTALILNMCMIFINHSRNISLNKLSMLFSHLGLGILGLSITLNVIFQKEIDFIGKISEKIQDHQFIIKLNDIKFSKGANYYRQIAEFWIENTETSDITILKPENRLYIIEKQLSQESDIYSYITYDLYAVLNQIDNTTVHAKIYYRPFISFIWFSMFLIIIGLILSAIGKIKQYNIK